MNGMVFTPVTMTVPVNVSVFVGVAGVGAAGATGSLQAAAPRAIVPATAAAAIHFVIDIWNQPIY
ncbi:MAG: hypothetical protein ACM3SQ_10205 [Betaproteobacteria bacterium]